MLQLTSLLLNLKNTMAVHYQMCSFYSYFQSHCSSEGSCPVPALTVYTLIPRPDQNQHQDVK